MGKTQGDYASSAEFWTCFFGDRTAEIECWFNLAKRYGKKVLAPMAATGEIAFALAERNLQVVAVDASPEMVQEGRRSHSETASFRMVHADLTSLQLEETAFDFAFIASGDFHHFLDPASQIGVLDNIAGHLRVGGGIAFELFKPAAESWSTPRKSFEPLRPPADEKVKIWKDGATQFDISTGVLAIDQTLFVERNGLIEEYVHSLRLKLHTRDEVFRLLDSAGFEVVCEYGAYDLSPSTPEADKWILLAEKCR